MNIGFVTTRLFDRPGSGGEVCTARLLGALVREGHGVHVIGRGGGGGHAQPAGIRQVRLGPLRPPFDSLPLAARAGSLLSAWSAGQPHTVQCLLGGNALGRAQRHLLALRRRGLLDLLVVDHLQAYALVADIQHALPAPLVLMHNLESEGYEERAQGAALAGRWLQAAVLRREARLLRTLEQQVLQQAAVLACLSEPDAVALRERLRAAGAAAGVEVLPGFPPEVTGRKRERTRSAASPQRIGMLGTWTWGPNRAGLDWMLQQVLPLLPAHCVLVLAGTGLDQRTMPPRVQVLGRVGDPGAFYDKVDVVALASWTGSGVQEKAIEAIAAAPAVVATPHALRGLGPDLPPHVTAAADADQFARACTAPPAAPARAQAVQAWAAQRAERYTQALQRCLQLAAAQAGPSFGLSR